MIEYKLLGKDNRPITLDKYEDISKIITDIFPTMQLEVNKMYRSVREKRGILNGETFYVYCRDTGTRIILPLKYEESIKERLEVLAELKFEKI